MIYKTLNFLVPGIGPAGLPLPLTAQALLKPDPPVRRPEAAETDCATRTPDPGSIEFDSWAAYLRHSVR